MISLSANPLGITIVPLFVVGFLINLQRDLILRDQLFAQTVLGLSASAFVPGAVLLMLLTGGHGPALSWFSLWQGIVMTVGGAIATPALFLLFGWFDRRFTYRSATEMSFRPDREIRRVGVKMKFLRHRDTERTEIKNFSLRTLCLCGLVKC